MTEALLTHVDKLSLKVGDLHHAVGAKECSVKLNILHLSQLHKITCLAVFGAHSADGDGGGLHAAHVHAPGAVAALGLNEHLVLLHVSLACHQIAGQRPAVEQDALVGILTVVIIYVEKHYGEGEGSGERILNPVTKVYVGEGSSVTFETTQIKGVDSTNRNTEIVVGKNAEVIINEKLMTHGNQTARSDMEIILEGEGANGRVLSRSVATDESEQVFYPKMTGKAECFGHVECDSIIMGKAKISSIPAIIAEHPDSVLVHEAAIGKIAGEQLLKLMTLGLDEKQAEERILKGFLD